MKKLLAAVLLGAALTACADAPVTPTPTPPLQTTTRATPVAAPAILPDETATIERVIDGDTLVLADARRVRVLGIDSCERGTRGGTQATEQARELLPVGEQVELRREAGVDVDRYDRALRYVTLSDGRDLGEVMVTELHTGVYDGENDASPEYVARLRALDVDGRSCGSTPTSTTTTTPASTATYEDDDVNLPDGALTGGYCARKWWC